MTFEEYRVKSRDFIKYDEETLGLSYPAMGLVGECGELVDAVEELGCLDVEHAPDDILDATAKEIGDAFWYCPRVLEQVGGELSKVGEVWQGDVDHHAMQALIKAARLNDKAKKILRDGPSTELQGAVRLLLGETMTHLVAACRAIGLTPEEVMEMNIDKLSGRKRRGTIGGSGDSR